MRQIKFRVWDSSKEKMIINPEISFGQSWWGVKDIAKGDCKLMQFTGILDRNGKDIYEDDRVKIVYDIPRSEDEDQSPIETEGIVSWNEHSTGWILRCKSPLSVDTDGTVMNSIVCGTRGYREVVGNIYENPIQL